MRRAINQVLHYTTLILFAGIIGCGVPDNVNSCTGRSNPSFHLNYFELCGNSEEPVVKSGEQTVTMWVEVDWPFTNGGTVWFDDLILTTATNPSVNLLSNPSFDQGLSYWDHQENYMCLSSDTNCTNIQETTMSDVWTIDNGIYYSAPASVRVYPPGYGYQTHLYQVPLISLSGIPVGTALLASASVRIEGDLQMRMGLDFRDSAGNIRAVNGKVLQGQTNGWIEWTLR